MKEVGPQITGAGVVEVEAVPASFDAFFRSQYGACVRLAFVLLGDRGSAEEASQEALFAAFRRWSEVAELERPDAWVRKVLLNRCRSVGRRRTVERAALSLLPSRSASVVADEHDDELWAHLRSLPRRQAQVVALVVVEDRSVTDVATLLGCNENTVRTHLRRGRLRLAELLGGGSNAGPA